MPNPPGSGKGLVVTMDNNEQTETSNNDPTMWKVAVDLFGKACLFTSIGVFLVSALAIWHFGTEWPMPVFNAADTPISVLIGASFTVIVFAATRDERSMGKFCVYALAASYIGYGAATIGFIYLYAVLPRCYGLSVLTAAFGGFAMAGIVFSLWGFARLAKRFIGWVESTRNET